MQTWMIVLAGVIVVLPFVLMIAFNGPDRTDSRGHRISHEWRVTRKSEP